MSQLIVKSCKILGATLAIALMLSTGEVLAEKSGNSSGQSQFEKIEQPWQIKGGVTLLGVGLIGLELWWFLFSKSQAKEARRDRDIQEVEIIVDGGYNPDRIRVRVGEPVRINFLRKDPSSCLERVIIPDFQKAVDLSLNRRTSVEFTPEEAGDYSFHCGMNMFRGAIEARQSS